MLVNLSGVVGLISISTDLHVKVSSDILFCPLIPWDGFGLRVTMLRHHNAPYSLAKLTGHTAHSLSLNLS